MLKLTIVDNALNVIDMSKTFKVVNVTESYRVPLSPGGFAAYYLFWTQSYQVKKDSEIVLDLSNQREWYLNSIYDIK